MVDAFSLQGIKSFIAMNHTLIFPSELQTPQLLFYASRSEFIAGTRLGSNYAFVSARLGDFVSSCEIHTQILEL